mmetsp:Transcript_10246/g.14975  ORF Transcript_10246/g.14975 Transcript_10246/m.14975 type:complete len:264 (+) Transcript_10246:203-994(+)
MRIISACPNEMPVIITGAASKGRFQHRPCIVLFFVAVLSSHISIVECQQQERKPNDPLKLPQNDRGDFKKKLEALRDAVSSFASAASSSTAIAGLAASATVAAVAMAAASVEQGVAHEKQIPIQTDEDDSGQGEKSMTTPPLSWSLERIPDESGDADGARLLSASLGLVSSSFGLVADTVRIAGDTAAGITGSSIKVMGSVVKSFGSGLDSAGALVAGQDKTDLKRRPLTSELRRGSADASSSGEGIVGLVGSTRRLAGKSVR